MLKLLSLLAVLVILAQAQYSNIYSIPGYLPDYQGDIYANPVMVRLTQQLNRQFFDQAGYYPSLPVLTPAQKYPQTGASAYYGAPTSSMFSYSYGRPSSMSRHVYDWLADRLASPLTTSSPKATLVRPSVAATTSATYVHRPQYIYGYQELATMQAKTKKDATTTAAAATATTAFASP